MSTHQEIKGLARARDIYNNRTQRAEELKSEGCKVFGYFCCYAPVELMTALDIVPLRVLGDVNELITKGGCPSAGRDVFLLPKLSRSCSERPLSVSGWIPGNPRL